MQKIERGNWPICSARGLSDKAHFLSTQTFMMMPHVRDYVHGALCAGPTAEAMAKASEVLISSAGGQVA